MGRKATSGGVRPKGDRIEVRFMWQGRQIAPTLNLKPNAANLKHAVRLRQTVVDEIAGGTFQFARYFPDYKHRAQHQPASGAEARTFGDWAALWGKLSNRDLEHSTLTIYLRHLRAYWLPVFAPLMPARITHEMILERLSVLASDCFDETTGRLHKGIERKTQNNIMIPLRGVFDLICKPPSQMANPTEGIANLKTQKAKPDPFAPDEVNLILAEIGRRSSDATRDYFEFSFYTGLRPSEQIALRWEDVDLRGMTVLVHRSMVLTKEKARTKTNVERLVELNARAAAVIQRQRSRTQARGEHVFFNPSTDRPYADEQAQRAAWVLALRAAKVRYRPPKECRDTSVTLALMAGANPVWVAAQHGHSVTVMMKDYAKWIPSADRGANLAAVNRALGESTPARKNAI